MKLSREILGVRVHKQEEQLKENREEKWVRRTINQTKWEYYNTFKVSVELREVGDCRV